MTIVLRRTVSTDAYLLWLWANDPAARAASGNRAMIGWEEHVSWLEGRLSSPDALLLLGLGSSDRPVGTIRFETQDQWASARLSYLVAPESRGLGLGRRLLVLGSAAVLEVHPATRLEALVRPANPASSHLFRSLGWTEEGSTPEFVRFVAPGRSDG